MAIALVLQNGVSFAMAQSPDDIQGHWAQAEIDALMETGVVRGYEDGSFRPDDPITRAEFVSLLNRAAGLQASGESAGFTDVQPGDWFAGDAALAAAVGTITGFEDGTFRPGSPITRQEVAVILARALDLGGGQRLTFRDPFSISPWAAEGVAATAAAGFMKGYPDGTFGGSRPVTRAEAAALVQRAQPRMVTTMARPIQVFAVDQQGEPLTAGMLRAHRKGERSFVAAAEGGQTTFYLKPGEYEFTAVEGGLAGHAAEKVIPGVTAVHIITERTATLSGTVVDDAQRPVVGAVVALTTNPTFFGITGADGSFTVSVLPGRDYSATLAFYANGEGAFDPDLSKPDPALAVLDNANARLPDSMNRPRVSHLLSTFRAPEEGKSLALGQFDAISGKRVEQVAAGPQPEPQPQPPTPPQDGPPPSGGGGGGGGGYTPPSLERISITPANGTVEVGRQIALTVTGHYVDGSSRDITGQANLISSDSTVAPIAARKATGLVEGTVTVTAKVGGVTATTALQVVSLAGPPVDLVKDVSMTDRVDFLYTGENPLQKDVQPETIVADRVAVLRGRVTTREGEPLAGVKVTVLNHPEFGYTLTRADGMFDMAVNGGGQLTVQYAKESYLTAQRDVITPWQDFVAAPDVAMIQADPKVTTVDLAALTEIQVAQGTTTTDADGTRTATVLIPPGTTAQMVLPDGSVQDLTTLSIRATEYTVGDGGPDAMPAELPPTTAYTYAVELSVDEAMAEGATEVRFSKPLPYYVENFRGFPVGTPVPAGYYDRTKGDWVSSDNGRVIEVLSETGGMADLNIDEDDEVDSAEELAALGIDDAERVRLAELYEPGQSLWRVPIPHFTPWDLNWPWGPPPDSVFPMTYPVKQSPPDKTCKTSGSIIGCQSQVLGEAVPVVGTPFALHYQSDRVRGGNVPSYTLKIPLTGEDIPDSLREVGLRVTVAGRSYRYTYPDETNQTHTFTWDGKDVYGRPVLGAQEATVTISYVYLPRYYAARSDLARSFSDQPENIGWVGHPLSFKLAKVGRWTGLIGAWDAQAIGLGGWSLSSNHVYDPVGKTLYLGDGSTRSLADFDMMATVVGTGAEALPETLTAAAADSSQTAINSPTHLAMAPDGTLYFVEGTLHRIRTVGTDGTVQTVVGTGVAGFSPDGPIGPETMLHTPEGITVAPDGSLYLAESGSHRVRRIYREAGTWQMETIAGTGANVFSGDGGPATQAGLYNPMGVAVGTDGVIYIADSKNRRVRRISPDGTITTMAGTGNQLGTRGDGGLARDAQLKEPVALTVGPDGSLYIADREDDRVRRITQDGLISTVAGSDLNNWQEDNGVPATEVSMHYIADIALGPDGSLYIAELDAHRVRRITPDGIIRSIAGSYDGYVQGANGAEGSLPTAFRLKQPVGVVVSPSGTLYLAERGSHRIRRLSTGNEWNPEGTVTIPAEDGSEIYVFDRSGRHLATLNGLTGQAMLRFTYNEAGHLTEVVDGDGRRTIIMRNGTTGDPYQIVAPGGQVTKLTLNDDGYLASIANPADETVHMSYGDGGLLRTYRSAAGGLWRFTYDDLGRLVKDQDPLGGFTALEREQIPDGFEVKVTKAEGRITIYRVEALPNGDVRRTQIDPAGGQTIMVTHPDGTGVVTTPDGAEVTWEEGPDPRWGMLVPVITRVTAKSPDGIISEATRTRTVALVDDDPSKLLTMTDTLTENGKVTTLAYAYDSAAGTRTVTNTSPEGRQSRSELDGQGRVVQQFRDVQGGIALVTATYMGGLLQSVSQGSYLLTLEYDQFDRNSGRTDSLGNKTTYEYDAADRLVRSTMPDGEVYRFEYNKDGLLAKVIQPDGSVYTQDYSIVHTETGFTAPEGMHLRTEYNLDKARRRVVLPDGRVQENTYDLAGRIVRTDYAEGRTSYTYLDSTDRPRQIVQEPTFGAMQSISFTYDSRLVTGMSFGGAATGDFSYTYNSSVLLESITLDGVTTSLTWDKDGLLTGYGPFRIARGGPEGAPSQTTNDQLIIDYTYDQAAEDTEKPTWPARSVLTAGQVYSNRVLLEWSAAADNRGLNGYRILVGTNIVGAVGANVRRYTVTGLTPETLYDLSVVAVDGAGNASDPLSTTVTTTADQPPTWPAGSVLTGTPAHYSVALTWPAAEDDTNITAYRVLQDGSQVGAELDANTRSFTVTGLQELSTYPLSVEAKDEGGQWSTGLTATFTTLADTPPAWAAPATLTYSNVTGTRLTLHWSEVIDDVGPHSFRIYRQGLADPHATAAGSARSLEVTALVPNTTYTFTVQVCDVKGQCTSDGPSVTVTTAAVSGIEGELTVSRVSQRAQNEEADDLSEAPAISADGDRIAFWSYASNLSDIDLQKCGSTQSLECPDVFVYDRSEGTLRLISVEDDGTPRTGHSGIGGLDISADGRYVIYTVAPYNYGSSNGYRMSGLRSIDLDADMAAGEHAVVDLVSGDLSAPSVSGDGRFVAYREYVTSGYRAHVLDRDADGDGIFDEVGATQTITLPTGSNWPRVSRDGHWVVYEMKAANGRFQIYAKDLRTDAEPVVLSVDADGALGTGDSNLPEISADGRYILFSTYARNIVDYDSNNPLIVRDRDTDGDGIFDEPGEVANTRVDLSEAGVAANGQNYGRRISGNGRYVVFVSDSDTLVPNDTNGWRDVFLRDLVGNQTMRLHTSSMGVEADYHAYDVDPPDLSDDGSVVVFTSLASNLIADDLNDASDIFVAAWVQTAAPAWSNGSLIASNVGDHTLILTWTPANDNVGVKAYHIYQDDTPIGSVAGNVTTFNVTGLVAETSYTFRVEAEDPSGNRSSVDLTVSATTGADTTPPALQSILFEGTKVQLTYNESLNAQFVPAPADFSVTANGVEQTVSAVALAGDKVRLTLGGTIAADASVSLDYAAGANPLQDPSGHPAANLGREQVTYANFAPPGLVSITSDFESVILTYDEPLDVWANLTAADFALVKDNQPYTIEGVDISTTRVTLWVQPPFDSTGYTLTYSGTAIADVAGNRAEPFTDKPVGGSGNLTRLAAMPAPLALDSGSGHLESRVHTVGASQVYQLDLSYDAMGRIVGKTETVGDKTTTYEYSFDKVGQLLTVKRDGEVAEEYIYDQNGNRISRRSGNELSILADFDAQGRITGLGGVSYTFGPAGFLTKRGTDTFTYSARGELLQATVAGGTKSISYSYDGLGRRVARTDASGTYQYLYGNPTNPMALTHLRDPQGVLTAFYYDEAGILYAMQRGATWYYIGADQVGTPKVVTYAAGNLVKTLDYDSFGRLLSDSNPDFGLPIGYAGGLADPDTGLIRFGFRDYDPEAGRWTSRDPILFQSRQANLYVYVANNPIGYKDPLGLFCIGVTAYAVFGGGVKLCIDDDGISMCGEAGVGTGGGVEIDPFGGTDPTGVKLKGEAKCQLGPGSIGTGVQLNECGWTGNIKTCVGPACMAVGFNGDTSVSGDSYKWGLGCEAKGALEGCARRKF